MTTLISVYNSESCVGRCDAKCYSANEPDCDCICRGMNHGAGKEQALDNTRELAQGWVDHAREIGQDIKTFELDAEAAHEPLFSLSEPQAG